MATGSRWAVSELLTSLTADQIKSHGGPPHKDTPLHVAVRKRDLELARIFVDAKANVDAKNVNAKLLHEQHYFVLCQFRVSGKPH